MKRIILGALLLLNFGNVFAAVDDDPILTTVRINQLELRATEGDDPLVWQAEAWVGKDLNKFWFKTDGEVVDGETESAEVQFLYSRAIAPFWDFQAGWKHDLKPEPSRDWLALGFKGLAPYLFEIDADVFVGQAGQIAFRLEAEYEYLFTQKLILSPEIEVNVYRQDDVAVGIGSGLSDIELGLRLRYEFWREFAPYVGVNWEGKFGKTADIAKISGGKTSDVQFVVGIRAWF